MRQGDLVLYGNLEVRPPGGIKLHPIKVEYPAGTPYDHPRVTPVDALPGWTENGGVANNPRPLFLDYRHQMPFGSLCLFERETRADNALPITAILKRAEGWFRGTHTGHWPTDTAYSELETHFFPVADALIPEQAYAQDLIGCGRLLFARDLRRHWLDSYQHEHFQQYIFSPLLMVGLTLEATIVEYIDIRHELAPVYPWIRNAAWDPTAIAAATSPGAEAPDNFASGYWWSLPQEPRPFQDGEGFLRELSLAEEGCDPWSKLSLLTRQDLALAQRLFLAFRYPAREGGYGWLIVVMPREVARKRGGVLLNDDREKRQRFERSPVFGIRVHRIRPQTLRLRNTSVVKDTVADKAVALIGLGALGSKVAEMLAQAGVGRFRLCDYDYLATGNVARHIGGISDYGARKTRVVMSRLHEINPYLDFESKDVINASAVEALDRLADFIAPADLVISTTADEGVESALNQIAVMQRKPVLYGRAIHGASIGRVFLVRPSRDACKECLAIYMDMGRRGSATPPDWIDIHEGAEAPLLRECGRPVLPGSAVDLSFIASLTARVALDFLEGSDADVNHWVWTQRAAGDVDPRLASPMSTFRGQVPRHDACRACREPDVTKLVLTDQVRDSMVSMVEGSPDAETGGVLIGFCDGAHHAIAIRMTGPGPNAVRSGNGVRRDVPYVQEALDNAAATLGGRGTYVGEWHSHLDPYPQPSPLDMNSLFGIAEAPNYLTRCPVMVIVGLDTATGKVATIRAWAFPIGGRLYEIPCRTTDQEQALGIEPAGRSV